MDLIIEKEQELFHACLRLTPAERTAYLLKACHQDSQLRNRVGRLLDAHQCAENATLNPLRSFLSHECPELIGPYRVVRVLGEGGMGVVYEAQQLEPVQRRVALKIVKLGLDTRQVLVRFAMERQVLAAMDHPYVAAVFDAGQTVSGRPYFVMELVDGVPLLEYCDRSNLSIRRRIELFVLICQAVQHSHQKGVIHRDLKPSNILVSLSAGTPIPKIIDFGIAKAISLNGPPATTPLTGSEQALGTPAYMSPEQAGRGGLDIDTRADVYSLGVILYELLAGSLPVDPAHTGPAGFLTMLAKGELRPRRLSARAGEGVDADGLIALRRGTTIPGLRRQLEGDLDWIVTKALETDRERRYPAALALAEDLERYLRREPVVARPPTISYRVGKFVRRHRIQVAALLLAVTALLGGAVAAGVGIVRASRAEAAAREDAATERAISDFLVRLFGLPYPSGGTGSTVTVRDLLEQGAGRVETELKGRPRAQSNLLATLSHIQASLGEYREAKTLAEKALAIERAANLEQNIKTSDVLLNLGRVDLRLGELEAAREVLFRALEIRVRLQGENSLDVATVLNKLGELYVQLEELDKAAAANQRALAIQRRMGGPDHIATFHSLRGMGIVEERKGNWQAALGLFRAAQAVAQKRYGENDPLVTDGLNNIARILGKLHRLDESQKVSERAFEIQKRLLGSNHPHVAFACHDLGHVLEEQGKLKEALTMYREGLRIVAGAYGPDNLRTGEIADSLGRLQARLGNLDRGRELLGRSVEIYRRIYGPNHSATLETQKQLALVEAEIARHPALESVPRQAGPVPAGR